MLELLRHLWHALAWWWSHQPPNDIYHPQAAGFIILIVAAIISIALKVAQFVADAGVLIFHTVEEAVKFAARGVVWLTGVMRKGFTELLGAVQHTFQSISRWLGNLYCDYQALKDKLARVFGPIIKFMQKVKRWYDLVFKQVVKPVLNLLQRFRKVLAIFKFFHLKWAQKLDADIAWLEGKITKNLLIVRQWLNLFGSWVNFLVDPAGALRMFPLVAGFFAALNVTWSGLFGTRFQGIGGAGSKTGSSTAVTVSFPRTLDDAKNGTGPAAVLHQRFAGRQAQFNSTGGLG